MTTPANPERSITIVRTDYEPSIPNVWRVDADSGHSTYHRTVDDALLMVRVMMERMESEERDA